LQLDEEGWVSMEQLLTTFQLEISGISLTRILSRMRVVIV